MKNKNRQRHMSSLLYEVNATDAFTFALVPTLMLMTALVACFLPARRAAATDPVEALRSE